MIALAELDPARDRGREVIYTASHGHPCSGVISSWNEAWVFVRYREGADAKATNPAQLTFKEDRRHG